MLYLGRQKQKRWRRYLLTTGLSLICMVLSSWLFVLARLKLLFFLWRREQHEPSPWGEEDREDVREPDLFITEISKQFDWNVCSSTNSWFCGVAGRREGGGHVADKSLDFIWLYQLIQTASKEVWRCREEKNSLIVAKCFITTFEIDGASCVYQVPSVKPFGSVIPLTGTQLEGHDPCVLGTCQ